VIDAVWERPKSHMNKSGIKSTAPRLPRPDVDNVAKAVLDSLQDVMGDDSLVARLVVEKSWGAEARTTVRIT
jgi:Holliday junction resolvase RusA-like endonuclease